MAKFIVFVALLALVAVCFATDAKKEDQKTDSGLALGYALGPYGYAGYPYGYPAFGYRFGAYGFPYAYGAYAPYGYYY